MSLSFASQKTKEIDKILKLFTGVYYSMDNDSMEFYNSKLLRFHKTSKGLMDRREREGVINGVLMTFL